MARTITIDDQLAEALLARVGPNETIDDAANRIVLVGLELTDARSDRGSALAVLIDEIGSTARGQLPLPDQQLLGEC